MVEDYEQNTDPTETPDDQDDDLTDICEYYVLMAECNQFQSGVIETICLCH